MVRIHRGSPVFVYPGLPARQTTPGSASLPAKAFKIPAKLRKNPPLISTSLSSSWSRTSPFHGENRGSNPLRDAKVVDRYFLVSNQTADERRRRVFHLLALSSIVQV